MLTLFLSISGGVSWVEALDPLSSLVAYRLGYEAASNLQISMKIRCLFCRIFSRFLRNNLKRGSLLFYFLCIYFDLCDIERGNWSVLHLVSIWKFFVWKLS